MRGTRRGASQARPPIYEVGVSYSGRNRLRGPSATWLWGCGFLSALACTGLCVILLVAIPIGFRLLPPDTQSRIVARLPFMRVLQPTREVVQLPTLDPARATAAAAILNATPIARLSTPTATFRPTATFEPLPATFRLDNARWEPQQWNNCGPANLVQGMRVLGVDLAQADVASWLKPNGNDANVSPWQIARYVSQFTSARALVRVNGDLTLLKRLVYNSFGVLIETGHYDDDDGSWLGHYLTIVGWNDPGGYLLALDTLRTGGDPAGFHEPVGDLDTRWQHFNRVYIVFYRPDQESRLREILGTAWVAEQNNRQALNRALTEMQLDRNNPFAWFNIGTNYAALGQFREAVAAYDTARSVGGGLPWRMLWYQFGPYKAYYEVGDYQTVIRLADNTLRNTTNVEETLYYRGLAYAALGSTAQAVSDLESSAAFNANVTQISTALQALQSGQRPAPEFL